MRWIMIFSWIALALMLGSTVATGTIYTWTDADGVKRYSNSQPPEGARNVQRIEELPYEPQDADRTRQEFDRMVDEAGRGADRQFEQQAEEKAREAQDEKEREKAQQDQRVEAERTRLEKQIAEIEGRGLGPNFTNGMKENQIRQIREKIERLESDPDAYFNDGTAGSDQGD